MKGITEEKQKSLGSILLNINIANLSIEHKFHLIDDKFQIPSHGIIGRDFLKRLKCNVDYAQMLFSVRPDDAPHVNIPLQCEIARGLSALPPNSETFKLFYIQNTNFPCVIPAQQIDENVFIPNTIAYDTVTYLRVLNTNSNFKILQTNKILKTENMNDYDIFTSSTPLANDQRNNRLEKLHNIIAQSSPGHAFNKLYTLCEEFSDIFHLEGDMPSINNFYQQKLNLSDNSPVFTRNYRLPQTQKAEINSLVNKLLNENLIELSTANYNSPLILVPKKSVDGTPKYRMCVDYRKLNRKLIPDRFPLPRVEDIFDNLGRAKYFSVMDLQAGFHQIGLDENSRKYTTFSTDTGMYQWKVLPFGLSVAPSSFSRMMALAFSNLSPEHCFSYMDDLIVIGFSDENHISNLRRVFETCRRYNLRVNPLKCQFFKTEVSFLGHICTDQGLKPDPAKLHAVRTYPRPHDKDSVRRFVAFTNYYRRFIENFAKITKPLTALTRKRAIFNWSSECERSFQLLKEKLLSEPILKYPNFDKPFKIVVDASNYACGGILSQQYDGIDMPITYISKSFKKGELNKPPIEKELLAVHFAITQLRPYLYGRHFTVNSDHKPLIYLYNLKNPSSRLSRIRLDLEEYDFEIQYIRGRDNVVADALSRISIKDLKESHVEAPILAITRSMTTNFKKPDIDNNLDRLDSKISVYEDFSVGYMRGVPRIQTKSLSLHKLKKSICGLTMAAYSAHRKIFLIKLANEGVSLRALFENMQKAASVHGIKLIQLSINDTLFSTCTIDEFKESGNKVLTNLQICLIKPPKKVMDEGEKMTILGTFHDNKLFGGHTGTKKMYAGMRAHYFWKNMTKDIANFIRNCQNCKMNKHRNHTKEPMILTQTPARPFDTVIIDTIGPLPKSVNGNLYAVTMICDLTKYLICAPTQDKSARSVAKAIFEKCILIHGPMKSIRTDRGTEYVNETIKELCKLMNIKHNIATAYHHQSVGSIERNHREFNAYIRQYLNNNLENWDTYLEYFSFCYNIQKHGSNDYNYSPYELIYARNPNLPSELLNGNINPLYNHENYIGEARFRLQAAHAEASKLIDRMKIRNKYQYDKSINPLNLKIGDTVYLKVEPYNKFSTLTKRCIVSKINEPNITITDGIRSIEVHKNRVIK